MASLHGDVLQLPVIDLSNPPKRTGDDLVKATSRWGFVYIKSAGSGFTPEVIKCIFDMVRLKA